MSSSLIDTMIDTVCGGLVEDHDLPTVFTVGDCPGLVQALERVPDPRGTDRDPGQCLDRTARASSREAT